MLSLPAYTPVSAVSSILVIIPGLILCEVIWVIYARWFHPLSHVPGPFLASVTKLWIIQDTLNGNTHNTQRALHQKYGPVVRVAPDEVICADPTAMKYVYRIQNPLIKTDFYTPFADARKAFTKNLDIFVERDEKIHGQRRRIINHMYTLTNILKLEPLIDECSELFIKKIGELADADQVVDLGEWLQWYTFDAIGQLFFGKMFGFMAKAEDHESWIVAVDNLIPYMIASGLAPPYARPFIGLSALFSKAARRAIGAAEQMVKAAKSSTPYGMAQITNRDDEETSHRNDLLQQMFDIVREKGDKVNFTIGDMRSEAHVALLAGADTTAVAMRAVMYFLMKNPSIYEQVQAEIDQAADNGHLSSPAQYSEVIKLPLLCASIKEAMRMHPSAALAFPRESPPGGMELCGTFIPAGYGIGMNPMVVQRDKPIFGEDADTFRPQRWLEADNSVNMDKHMLLFGAGTRTCIGKHIALTEVHKLLPYLMRRFDVMLVNPEKEWSTYNGLVHKQTGITVHVKRRVA